ncbi:MAG: hypothetical protein SVT52_03185 [Planctomycetota bacterium]|nr:hypothetical protein [Planctomycetota bacterium]
MRYKHAGPVCLALFVTVLAAGSSFSAPPVLNIPDTALRDQLLAVHEKQIESRVKYWADMIRTAENEKDILAARDGLVSDYLAYDSVAYRYSYARLTAKHCTPLLKLNNPAKQINVSLVISRMPQVASQSALDKMVVHANPAVRYLGWAGYGSLRMLILAQGSTYQRKMYTSLAKAADKETSAPVVGMIFKVLNLPPVATGLVAAADLREARKQFFVIIEKNWPTRCRQVLGGDAQMAEACQKAIAALSGFAPVMSEGKRGLKEMLQMIVDMAWCSARAYDLGTIGKTVVIGEIKLKTQAKITAGDLPSPGQDTTREVTVITVPRSVRITKTATKRYSFCAAGKDLVKLTKAVSDHGSVTVQKRLNGQAVVNHNLVLLKNCETLLKEMTGKPSIHIEKALTDPDIPPPRGAAVRMAVLDWIGELKDSGVVEPKIQSPK